MGKYIIAGCVVAIAVKWNALVTSRQRFSSLYGCCECCRTLRILQLVLRYLSQAGRSSRREEIRYRIRVGLELDLTHSTPAIPNCCCSKGPPPYWSNPPFLIFDIRALWRSVLSARVPECQKLQMVGYTSMAKCKELTESAVKGLRRVFDTGIFGRWRVCSDRLD